MAQVKIRCQAKTEDSFREILVDLDKLIATCSCNLNKEGLFCSHIDAVLVAGERYMVPSSDHAKADKAMKALAGLITAPPDWKGSWRSRMAWRGLSQPKNIIDHSLTHGDDYYNRPKICFTGNGPMKRAELLDHARNAGWYAVDYMVQNLKVLVAESPTLNTTKLQQARKKGIPIISYDEYFLLSSDGELTGA